MIACTMINKFISFRRNENYQNQNHNNFRRRSIQLSRNCTFEHLKSMELISIKEGNKLTDVEIREFGVMDYRAMSGIMFVFIG